MNTEKIESEIIKRKFWNLKQLRPFQVDELFEKNGINKCLRSQQYAFVPRKFIKKYSDKINFEGIGRIVTIDDMEHDIDRKKFERMNVVGVKFWIKD